mmetsp:Transcript_21115/g.38117  ORF Transcript_21115/g.38117 Transcript_21115/m.38117 type:complete len:182 (-) Transcript_21115:42-587(-)
MKLMSSKKRIKTPHESIAEMPFVVQIRANLKELGLATKGNRAELVDRLQSLPTATSTSATESTIILAPAPKITTERHEGLTAACSTSAATSASPINMTTPTVPATITQATTTLATKFTTTLLSPTIATEPHEQGLTSTFPATSAPPRNSATIPATTATQATTTNKDQTEREADAASEVGYW